MENASDVKLELIAELQNAVQTASRDYFIWTKGSIIYDHGVEALMQVYAAKRLFDLFAPQYGLRVHMEESLAGIEGEGIPRKSGRIDLTLRFDEGPTYFVEFKRYTNESNIKPDIDRLRSLITNSERLGFFVAPCFLKKGEETNGWPRKFADKLENENHDLKVHLSESRILPSRFVHQKGWSYDQAMIIEVKPHDAELTSPS